MISRKTNQLIGNPRDHGQQQYTHHHPCNGMLDTDKNKQNHTHQHHKQKKTGSASVVQPTAPHHVLHCQRPPFFNTVDAFMFRTVIHIDPLDLLHGGNQYHIQQKNSNSDQAFQQSQQRMVSYIAVKKRTDIVGKHHKYRNCQNDCEEKRNSRNNTFHLIPEQLLHHFVGNRLFSLLFFIKGSGIRQCPASKDQ